jgi:putative Mn2+ efflux pump MntP
VSFPALMGVALALAMDAFAVALGLSAGLRGLTPSQSFRLAGFFGFFQFAMPLAGWAAGRSVLPLIQKVDHWLAAGLLCLVAGRMIYGFFRKASSPGDAGSSDPFTLPNLILLSVATSIDALAVGLSLALLEVPILFPALIIGAVAFALSLIGTRLGLVLGRMAGRWAELVGALVLLVIAGKILLDHL